MRATSVLGRLAGTLLPLLAPALLAAQGTGALRGTVTDSAGHALPGAGVHVVGTVLGARVDSAGRYQVVGIPAGSYRVRVNLLGYASDTTTLAVPASGAAVHDFHLRPSAAVLGSVVVTAPRLGESQASALERRESAPNIVNVLAGDVIRDLPNLNAAEAAGRIPGVTTERDEGEGKFVQIRGTEPRLSNVTIDGAHVPGTEAGNRIPKLDDVPSDVLGAIEVSKTLTAEQDADAIGGSVNLVTKVPEGAPHGYVSAQYGQMTLLSRNQFQGGFAYGGRVGTGDRFGFLLGGSADRNNRAINDLEPAWGVDANGSSYPLEWSQRDYLYRRNRYGLGGDLDYRFAGGSSVFLRGLYSYFENFGTTYVDDVATAQTGSTSGDTGDSASTGGHGYGTGVEVTRESYNRTPREQMYGFTTGARTQLGVLSLEASANVAGTSQRERDYRFSPFVYDGPGGQGLTVAYDATDRRVPTFHYLTSAMANAASDPGNFTLDHYSATNATSTGYDDGGALDFSAPWSAGTSSWSSMLRFGARIRDEQKSFAQNRVAFATGSPLLLSQVGNGVNDPGYYHDISTAFVLGPVPDDPNAEALENAHASQFVNRTNAVRNALASFSGSERIYAGYVSNTLSAGATELYLGLRVENTHVGYSGNEARQDSASGVTSILPSSGTGSYTDLFPSAQLKLRLDQNSDVRVAVTRGIARPDYSLLAPSLQLVVGQSSRSYSGLTSGNPDLRPEHAWNYDLLAEHFFPSVGVLSGGVFYKRLSDLIFTRQFTYTGAATGGVPTRGTHPENGGTGRLLGEELEWAQRLVFLPGLARGLGFDMNYTHVDSRGLVDASSGREAPLPRQAPNLANVALTYDLQPVSARLAWAYEGANITSYGDGLADGAGDTYFYAHSQIDASLIYTLTSRVQLQLQGLNLNNAVFGFFQGTPKNDYSIQREYYGRTIYIGAKYGL